MFRDYDKAAVLCVALLFALFCLCGCDDTDSSDAFQDPKKKRAEDLYEEGRRLFLTCDPNNYQQALHYFDETLSINSDYAKALAGWAETLSMWHAYNMNETMFENAMHRAQRATRLAPELDMGYRAAADIYRHHRNPKTGEFDTEYALDMIERAMEINPRSAENLYVKGSIYLTKNDPLKAIEVLNKAKKANPDLGKTYFNLASANQMLANRIKTNLKQVPASRKDMKKNLQRDMTKRYNMAEQHYKTYQSLVPGNVGGYCALGVVYLHRGKTDKAEKMFRKTVSLKPNPDPAQYKWIMKSYYHLADMERQRGNPEEALVFNKSALDIFSGQPDFIAQRINICKELQKTDCVKEYKEKLDQLKEKQRAFQNKKEDMTTDIIEGGTVKDIPLPEEETGR